MPKVSLSPWQRHVRDWGGCTRCELSKGRTFVCLARGELPSDILFVGEAPGRSEDLVEIAPGSGLGTPFVGPAGKLLDSMVAVALGPPGDRPRLCFTNLVGCVPLDSDGDKAGEPEPRHIKACAPRLAALVAMAGPKLIVCVGRLPRRWIDRCVPHRDAFAIDIDHPAHILREPPAHRNLMRQRAEVRLRNGWARIVAAGGRIAPTDPLEPAANDDFRTPDDVPF